MTKTQRFISIAMYALGAALGYYAFAIFAGWGVNWDITAWEPKARAAMFLFCVSIGVLRGVFIITRVKKYGQV